MKHIVEYKLHHPHTPYFIEDGGYFVVNNKLIGVTKDDSICYVPAAPELVHLTNQDLIDRVVAMDMFDSETEQALTVQEKTDMANAWLSAKGFI